MLSSPDLWWYFVLVAGVVALPGMDMAYVIASALTGGLRGGAVAVAGIAAGGLIHVLVGATGIAALLVVFPEAFNALLIAGAAYMAWIGLSLLRTPAEAATTQAASAPAGAWTIFRRALLTCLLNPKAYAFVLAVLPPFLRSDARPLLAQALILAAITVATQIAIYGAIAVGVAQSRRWFGARPRASLYLARTVGVLLIAAAALTTATAWRPVAPAGAAEPDPASSPAATTTTAMNQTLRDGSRDFDFVFGRWTIANRRLKQRWAGSDDWDAFESTSETTPVLDGTSNTDQYRAPARGITGMSLRAYNKATGEWWLYWINSRDGVLQPPVIGRFDDGVGTFYGDDVDDGVPIRVRYLWSRITPTTARWEQAFSKDGGASWETNWIMDHTRADAQPAAERCCDTVELRQYALKPGRRDELIALFEREFVETQEAAGMRVIGQFRDRGDADRFVWLRGFAGMEARRRALEGFYGGPTWREHRDAANATMIDVSDVLLLKPASPGSGIALPAVRPGIDAPDADGGLVLATIYRLTEPADAALLALFATAIAPAHRRAGAVVFGSYATEASENTFPRLSVREGEHVFVWLAGFENAASHAAYRSALAADPHWREAEAALRRRLAAPAQAIELSPTRRSLLRHGRS